MDSILNFLSNNYKWFLIAAGVLVLALIGFIADSKKKKKAQENALNTAAVDGQAMAGIQTPVAPVAPEATINNPTGQNLNVQTNMEAPSMTFNDMPTPSANNEVVDTAIPSVMTMDPIQNNMEFNNSTVQPENTAEVNNAVSFETPSINPEPVIQMPSIEPVMEMPNVEMPTVVSPVESEIPAQEPTIIPEPVVMPDINQAPVESTEQPSVVNTENVINVDNNIDNTTL
jgi:hypothetical protein